MRLCCLPMQGNVARNRDLSSGNSRSRKRKGCFLPAAERKSEIFDGTQSIRTAFVLFVPVLFGCGVTVQKEKVGVELMDGADPFPVVDVDDASEGG